MAKQKQKQQSVALAPVDAIQSSLARMEPEFKKVAPRHLPVERLIRTAISCIRQNPYLMECDRASLYASLMTAARLGLEPDGILGHGHLVPFRGKVQFIPGYQGLIKLADLAGWQIQAGVVYEGDKWDHDEPSGQVSVSHQIPTSGKLEAVWARGLRLDGKGVPILKVLDKPQVDKVRDQALAGKKNRDASPWVQWYEEMACKTGVRRVAKFLPAEVRRAAELDALYEGGKYAQVDDMGDVVVMDVGDDEENHHVDASPLDHFATEGATKEATEEAADPGQDIRLDAEARELSAELAHKISEAFRGADDMVAVDNARDRFEAARDSLVDGDVKVIQAAYTEALGRMKKMGGGK